LQPDGKAVVCGNYRSGANDLTFVLRLTTSGALDTTFANGGIFRDTTILQGPFCTLAMQPNGSIVTTAPDNPATTYSFRLDSLGALDSTYGTSGRSSVDFVAGGQETPYDTVVLPDGRLRVIGNALAGDKGMVVGLTANGARDASWGTNGLVLTDLGVGSDYLDGGVELQPDGNIVASGDGQAAGGWRMLVYRFTPTGGLDTTFNTTGYVALDWGSGIESNWGGLILQDGKIVVGGSNDLGANVNRAVERLDGTATIADYGGGSLWSSGAATSLFGMCLAAVSNASTTLTTAPGATCGASDGAWWRAIPKNRITGPDLATSATGVANGTVDLRFGLKVGSTQRAGKYGAQVVFEVIAP
ncbi:MAG: hypothetical protein H7287_13255, partial [Thermoleophilia bacterium]|nr:hypothetical protein [Thermoleophilia bacterium]